MAMLERETSNTSLSKRKYLSAHAECMHTMLYGNQVKGPFQQQQDRLVLLPCAFTKTFSEIFYCIYIIIESSWWSHGENLTF